MPRTKQKGRKAAVGPNWGACKQVLKDFPRPGLLALLQELYRLSPENRAFFHARLVPGAGGAAAVEEAAAALRRMMTPANCWNDRFRHIDAKRVVDAFAKANPDPADLAQLLLADLEISFKAFSEAGDDPALVTHLGATIDRLWRTLEALPAAGLRDPLGSLEGLAARWGGEFGYGLSDDLIALHGFCRDRFEADVRDSPTAPPDDPDWVDTPPASSP